MGVNSSWILRVRPQKLSINVTPKIPNPQLLQESGLDSGLNGETFGDGMGIAIAHLLDANLDDGFVIIRKHT